MMNGRIALAVQQGLISYQYLSNTCWARSASRGFRGAAPCECESCKLHAPANEMRVPTPRSARVGGMFCASICFPVQSCATGDWRNHSLADAATCTSLKTREPPGPVGVFKYSVCPDTHPLPTTRHPLPNVSPLDAKKRWQLRCPLIKFYLTLRLRRRGSSRPIASMNMITIATMTATTTTTAHRALAARLAPSVVVHLRNVPAKRLTASPVGRVS